VRRATWGKVVVLGDSYSSGEAADEYGVAGSTESCHASANAFGPVLAGRIDVPDARLVVRACTGATTAHLAGRYADHHQPPQFEALDADTSLVTLTIGGNDLDWAGVVSRCARPIARVDCLPGTGLAAEVARSIEAIGPTLNKAYGSIRRRAPHARVVVVGYPRFFPASPADRLSYAGLALLSVEEQAWMNDQFDAFNEVIERSAMAAGVEYVDVGGALHGHELTTARPWMRGPTAGDGPWGVSAASFHPTADGQEALADLVERQIRQPATPVRS
jgi:lysophospholipase L1-like esterase